MNLPPEDRLTLVEQPVSVDAAQPSTWEQAWVDDAVWAELADAIAWHRAAQNLALTCIADLPKSVQIEHNPHRP